METMISVDYLDVYKALASPVRLKLIKLLWNLRAKLN